MESPWAQQVPDVQQGRGAHQGLLGEGGEGGTGIDDGVGRQVGLHDVHYGVGVFNDARLVSGHGEGLGARQARGQAALMEGRHGEGKSWKWGKKKKKQKTNVLGKVGNVR